MHPRLHATLHECQRLNTRLCLTHPFVLTILAVQTIHLLRRCSSGTPRTIPGEPCGDAAEHVGTVRAMYSYKWGCGAFPHREGACSPYEGVLCLSDPWCRSIFLTRTTPLWTMWCGNRSPHTTLTPTLIPSWPHDHLAAGTPQLMSTWSHARPKLMSASTGPFFAVWPPACLVTHTPDTRRNHCAEGPSSPESARRPSPVPCTLYPCLRPVQPSRCRA